MTIELDKIADALLAAIVPDDDVKATASVRRVVREDGTVDPGKVPIAYPWQSRDFILAGPLVPGANRGGILQFPQGGIVRRLAARCRTAPTGAPAEFTITVNGANTSPPLRISIPAGENAADVAADVVAGHILPAMSTLGLIVSAANGVADVTVTIHFEPVLTV